MDSPDSRGAGEALLFAEAQVALCEHLDLVEFTLLEAAFVVTSGRVVFVAIKQG